MSAVSQLTLNRFKQCPECGNIANHNAFCRYGQLDDCMDRLAAMLDEARGPVDYLAGNSCGESYHAALRLLERIDALLKEVKP